MKAAGTRTRCVIGAETLSKITDYTDRTSCILFGDGACAVIVQCANGGNKGILYSTMASDGSGWTSLNCQAHGSRFPVGKKLDDPKKIYMQINGREVYQLAVRRIVETVNECLDKCGLTIGDVAMLIPHQMNARIIESAAKCLEIAREKVFINITQYGNTSAASIPIALDECVKTGKVKAGDIVILVTFVRRPYVGCKRYSILSNINKNENSFFISGARLPDRRHGQGYRRGISCGGGHL